MSIPGKLEIDRADRRELDRRATLRDPAMQPHDILVEDLSTSGCKIIVDLDLTVDTLVRLGMSGVGTRAARIVRGSRPEYGCGFIAPMSDGEIRRAVRAETVVPAAFPLQPEAEPEAPEDTVPMPSVETRAAIPAPRENETPLPTREKPRRHVPLWIDGVALLAIVLFAIYVWRVMDRYSEWLPLATGR